MKFTFGILFVFVGALLIGASFVSPTFMVITGGGGGGQAVSYTLDGTLSANPTSFNSGSSTTLTFLVTQESNSPSIEFMIGTSAVHSTVVSQDGSYTYTWNSGGFSGSAQTEIRYISAISSNGEIYWSTIYGPTLHVQGQITIPNIESASSSANPATVGNVVDFSSTINWDGQVGTVVWSINGQQISGNEYTFQSSGIFTVEVSATNSAGTSTYTFNEQVNNVASTGTGGTGTGGTGTGGTGTGSGSNGTGTVNTNLTNIGTFWLATNSTLGNIQLDNKVNISLPENVYLKTVTFYYVENHGTTENMKSLYLVVNNQIYTISLTNSTLFEGHLAYYIKVNLGAGKITVSGFITPSNNLLPIQLFSTLFNDQSIKQITTVNYITMIFGFGLVGIGLFLIFRRLI